MKKKVIEALMNDNFKRLFGITFGVESIKIKGLPVYITARRSFFRLSYYDNDFILVKLSSDERFGVVALEKQAVQISAKAGKPVAFEFENISRAQRDSLLERNIPFISNSGQLYLPFLGMMLSDRFIKRKKETELKKMMPITQALFLYLVYIGKDKLIMKKDAADRLCVTRTSITRASEQLVALDLISQEIRGKEYYMSIKGKGIEIYEKAKPYLINPIQKKITVIKNDIYDSYSLSGESALAKTTMLNSPEIPEYAVYKSDIDLDDVSFVDTKWNPEVEAVNIELWKYDPTLFAKNGIVDPISLALCFEDNADERIESSIEEYLEDYKW
jgi:DNA-binding MarR family transcriptional regulator